MTNLTPAQLEQFESTFRYFDKDETNTLSVSELAAALASLGIVYSVRTPPSCLTLHFSFPAHHLCSNYASRVQEEDIDVIGQQLEQEYGATTFEAFINLLVRTVSMIFT